MFSFTLIHKFYFSSKRRKNDEINKARKPNEDGIDEGQLAGDEATAMANHSEANETNTTKRVPLSLEEMLEKNKREQEATSKVVR